MSNPFFSVIIPAYNVEKFIGKTLDSFAQQSFKDFEIVAVNDGSTDYTIGVINSFSEKFSSRFKILTQHNQGVSTARNNGILQSNGEYLIFFDGDDFVEPDFLSEMYNLLKNGNIDIAFCGYDKVDQIGNQLDISDAVKNKLQNNGKRYVLKRFLFNNMLIWTGCAAYRKKIIIDNKLIFNKSFRHGEDQDFTIRAIYYSDRIRYSYKILAHYLQRSGSAVNSADPLKIRDDIRVYSTLKRFFIQKDDREFISIVENYKLPYNIYTVVKILARNGNLSEYKRLLDKKVYRAYMLKGVITSNIKIQTKFYMLLTLFAPKFIFNKFNLNKMKIDNA